MLTATNIRNNNASLFIPAQTGCPIKDSLDHSTQLGLHRVDYEAFSVQGTRVYRQVAADGNAAEARRSWISTQGFHDKSFAKANATEKSLGEGFLVLLNQILADTDAQYKREVASHYYQQLLNGVGSKITVLLSVLAELQAIATAIAPDTTDRKETFDALALVLVEQVGEELAYQMVGSLVTLTAGQNDERCEALVCAELEEMHRAKDQAAHIAALATYAEELASFEPLEQSRLEENHGNGGQIRTGVAVFDQEVAEKQRMIRRTSTTSFDDGYYFDRHINDLVEQSEGNHDQLQVALAQRSQWDDSVASNQAFEFAGDLIEFDETALPVGIEGLRTDAARWFCFLQPGWAPWNREEAGHAIRAYAQAYDLTAWDVLNLMALCPNSFSGIQRTKDKELQTVMLWAQQSQFKMRLSVEQVSRRVWSLLNEYTSQEDHTDFIIEEGFVTETSERADRLAQQTSALMTQLQADKHLTWMRHNTTYRELHSGLAKATDIGEANKLITEAYAITQMGKTNPDAKRLSVAQLAALKTRKEVTVARIKRNPSAAARALLAQANKLAVGSRIEEASQGANFLTTMNSLPLHEQDAVIAKLRAKQIRVGASATCKSLLAEIRGAHQVVRANGKEKWLKGMKWACYEKNAPNPGYLQGVNERYKALPRYEQTAVWQHLNA